jgi:hypothetical protein
LSEALPATPAPYLEPCAGPSLRSDTAGSLRTAGLVDALRRARKAPAIVPDEILDAQDSLERRIRAHLARGPASGATRFGCTTCSPTRTR